MRNQNLSAYDNKHSDELFYLPIKWYETDINVLTMDKSKSSKKELERLYLEAQEYDFLKGKIPQVLPDFLEEED